VSAVLQTPRYCLLRSLHLANTQLRVVSASLLVLCATSHALRVLRDRILGCEATVDVGEQLWRWRVVANRGHLICNGRSRVGQVGVERLLDLELAILFRGVVGALVEVLKLVRAGGRDAEGAARRALQCGKGARRAHNDSGRSHGGVGGQLGGVVEEI
jgi:hypothetical protein